MSEASCNKQPIWIYKDNTLKITVDSLTKKIHNDNEHNDFFIHREWFKQWELHKRFNGFNPCPTKENKWN